MPHARFTDRTIKAFKPPAEGQTDYYDEPKTGQEYVPGFGMRVSYGGTKTFFVKYVIHGKQRRDKLGLYPEMPLAAARTRARETRGLAAQGIDSKMLSRQDEEAWTFSQLVDYYIENHAKEKMPRSWPEEQRKLSRYCSSWADWKAADVSQADIIQLARAIKNDGAGIMANRVLASIRRAYSYAVKHSGQTGLTENPSEGIDPPAKENQRDRVYDDDEMRALWEAFSHGGTIGLVYKLCLATGQRLREVAHLRWDEVDFDRAQWMIPSPRTKNKLVHIVPLNDVALDVLQEARTLCPVWAFPSPTVSDRPVDAFSRAARSVRRASGVSDFRSHDLRRSVVTGITRLGFSQFVAGDLLDAG